MTYRERFLRAMRYEDFDRVPLIENWAWPETLERWKGEGYGQPDAPTLPTASSISSSDALA